MRSKNTARLIATMRPRRYRAAIRQIVGDPFDVYYNVIVSEGVPPRPE